MTSIRNILRRLLTTRVAWPILLAVALLCSFSLIALKSVSPERFDKQEIWMIAGVGVILVALLPHYNLLGAISYFLYAVTLVLLVAVFLAPEIQYTHRWFVLPGGVQLQPSELAKISFVLMLAWHLRHRRDLQTWQGLLAPFAMALVPFALIYEEPDLGTALLFPMVLFAMLLAAGASSKHLLIIAVVVLASAPAAYQILRPYQQDRLRHFVLTVTGREDDVQHNFQQRQSKIAIGSGGLSGQDDPSVKAISQSVPEAYTDFIFSVIGADHGFLGCGLVLVFYLGFFAASMEIAATMRDNFGRLLAVGLACMILCQAGINLAMTVGLMLVVGVALPFVSYGGSSLLASFLAAGLLLNISIRRFAKGG